MAAKSILLFGGTFNPPHFAHLLMVYGLMQHAKKMLGRDFANIEFILSMPWQKKNVLAPEHRQKMLELALVDWQKHSKNISINMQEVQHCERTGTRSYSINTLIERHAYYEKYFAGNAFELIYLIGQDQYQNLHTWQRWQELFDYAKIWVVSRNDASNINPNTNINQLNFNIPFELAKKIKFFDAKVLYQQLNEDDIWQRISMIWSELKSIPSKYRSNWLNGLLNISSSNFREVLSEVLRENLKDAFKNGLKEKPDDIWQGGEHLTYCPQKVLSYLLGCELYT